MARVVVPACQARRLASRYANPFAMVDFIPGTMNLASVRVPKIDLWESSIELVRRVFSNKRCYLKCFGENKYIFSRTPLWYLFIPYMVGGGGGGCVSDRQCVTSWFLTPPSLPGSPAQPPLLPPERIEWFIEGQLSRGHMIWFLVQSLPRLPYHIPPSKLDQRHTGKLRKRDNTLTGEGGMGWARSRIIRLPRRPGPL